MPDNKKYYWLKLKDTFFTDKRIKKLRKIAGGDTYTIIYLKMQLLSLQNEGELYFENIENTFEEEVALDIDEDVEDVKLTIAYLLHNGLLNQIETNIYELPETKICIGSETRNAESMRKLREKRKKDVTLLQDVTNCYTEKEKEIEIDKEIDIDIEREQEKPSLEEIKKYIKENNLNVDADKFYNYYNAGNWLDCKGQPVINWQQKLVSWNNNEKCNINTTKQYQDYEQRTYNINDYYAN